MIEMAVRIKTVNTATAFKPKASISWITFFFLIELFLFRNLKVLAFLGNLRLCDREFIFLHFCRFFLSRVGRLPRNFSVNRSLFNIVGTLCHRINLLSSLAVAITKAKRYTVSIYVLVCTQRIGKCVRVKYRVKS